MVHETVPKRRRIIGSFQSQISTTRSESRNNSINSHNARGKLKQNITLLYGEETTHQTKTFEQLRSKRGKLLCSLTFLERCRDENIIPKSLQVKFHKTNTKVNNILRRTSFALIREAIQDTRRTLDDINRRLLRLHLTLSNELHPLLWNKVEQLAAFRSETDAELTKAKQMKKFENLKLAQKPQSTIPSLDTKKLVHNLSSFPLSDAATSVLAKGFNFAVAPNKIPVENIICEVEASIVNMPSSSADKIRQDVVRILGQAKPPKKNISRDEHYALKDLQQNKDIIILPADKGNATVVMDIQEYDTKIKTLLQDDTYQPITSDPTTYLEKTTKAKIKSSKIRKEEQLQLIPREKSSKCPKLYGLPKIHKQGAPLRPIVSSIGSPLQELAKFLAKQLQPYAEEAESYVKNASHFIERIKDTTLDPGHMLVSFDIVSLFTNIPIDEAIDIIQRKYRVRADIMELVKHCLKNTYFIYNDQRYKQVEGAPMGSPLSPVVANLFMTEFETEAIKTATLKPKTWLRYVDDTFIVWTHGELELRKFLDHLNGKHDKIKFTVETEKDNQLPFLDVLIKRKPDGKLGHTVYRKPTHTDRYLNARSHHHPAQLKSVVKTLMTRSQRLTDEDNRKQEIDKMQITLQQNGFDARDIRQALRPRRPKDSDNEKEEPIAKAHLPYIKGTTEKISRVLRKHNIETTFGAARKIGQILPNAKTKINLEAQGVYEIPCRDCEGSYVGQTNRRINVRRDEHRNAVRKQETTSSLAEHVRVTTHDIDFDNTKVIANIEHKTKRIIREAIEIEKRPDNLNTRDDTQRLPTTWRTILSQINRNKHSPPTSAERRMPEAAVATTKRGTTETEPLCARRPAAAARRGGARQPAAAEKVSLARASERVTRSQAAKLRLENGT